MKKILHLAVFLGTLTITKADAQCNFTATITPKRPILCPFGTDTLSTQEYDSYQWFRNKHIIEGATSRTYVITQNDVGYGFTVAATKNGCTDTSSRVIVDGYVFLFPFIIETGDIGVYDSRKDALIECPDDTLILTMGEPYTQNLQWYDRGKAIEGANQQSYYVTTSGSYTACGAPEVCPEYNQCESIPINVIFENPVATISEKNDTLFASKAKRYQWIFNGQKITNATEQYYVPNANGKYKVATIDKYKCLAVSDPYLYKASSLISVLPNPVKDILHLHVDAGDAAKMILLDLYGNRLLQLAITQGYNVIALQNIHAGTYVVQVFDKQNQIIGSATIIKQ